MWGVRGPVSPSNVEGWHIEDLRWWNPWILAIRQTRPCGSCNWWDWRSSSKICKENQANLVIQIYFPPPVTIFHVVDLPSRDDQLTLMQISKCLYLRETRASKAPGVMQLTLFEYKESVCRLTRPWNSFLLTSEIMFSDKVLKRHCMKTKLN